MEIYLTKDDEYHILPTSVAMSLVNKFKKHNLLKLIDNNYFVCLDDIPSELLLEIYHLCIPMYLNDAIMYDACNPKYSGSFIGKAMNISNKVTAIDDLFESFGGDASELYIARKRLIHNLIECLDAFYELQDAYGKNSEKKLSKIPDECNV